MKPEKNWNPLNIISKNASEVGAYNLGIVSGNNGYNKNLEYLKKNIFEVIFLFGQDDLEIKKENESLKA